MPRSVRRLPLPASIAIVATLAITGCAPGPAPVPEELAYILEESDAISVTPTLDEALAATATMTIVEGGSVSATGADGTTYTLTIPPDALRSTATITMTPLAAIDGLPFGEGPAIGVQLEPSGLQLDAFATLDIEGPQLPPVPEQILYSYRGTGEQLGLAMPDVSNDGTRVLLAHFSGYGVGSGLLTDIEPIRQRFGGSVEAKIESEIAAARQIERASALSGELVERADLAPLWQLFEDQVLRPRIAAAGESCGNGLLAIQTASNYVRNRQLGGEQEFNLGSLGLSQPFVAAGRACLDEEYELCKTDHIVHRIIPVWRSLESSLESLQLGEEFAAVVADAKQKVRDCLTFSVDFDSTASGVADEVGITSVVEASSQFSFDTEALKFTSDPVTLVNTSVSFTLEECSFAESTGDGTFQVEDMVLSPSEFELTPQPNGEQARVGKIVAITLQLNVGLTTESAVQTCYGFSLAYPPAPWWSTIAEQASGPSFNTITEWEILGGEEFAVAQWNRPGPFGSDIGSATLRHEPR